MLRLSGLNWTIPKLNSMKSVHGRSWNSCLVSAEGNWMKECCEWCSFSPLRDCDIPINTLSSDSQNITAVSNFITRMRTNPFVWTFFYRCASRSLPARSLRGRPRAHGRGLAATTVSEPRKLLVKFQWWTTQEPALHCSSLRRPGL